MANKRIIEISGVKLEVDLSSAKRIDTFRVGDRVKVLVKKYSDNYEVHQGVIVAFDDFAKLPTITVCYIDKTYTNAELKFAYINAQSKGDVEITFCEDEHLIIEKQDILDRIQLEIDKKQEEILDLKRKRNYFDKMFGEWFPTE